LHLSAELEQAFKSAELAASQLPEMIASASAEIKERTKMKKIEAELNEKDLNTTDFNFASCFLGGDAQQIDGVVLTNRLPQMSTPKSKFLLSDKPDPGKAEETKESAFDFESAF